MIRFLQYSDGDRSSTAKRAGASSGTRTSSAARALFFLLIIVGCSGDASPQAAPTTLPSPSSIPLGIYSGRLDLDVTFRVDGIPQQTNESVVFTIVFDENGRFLDAGGVPFLVGETYWSDTGITLLEMFTKSITVVGDRIVLRFDLTVHADFGTVQAELTGSQTETITFNAAADTLTFLRTQQYSGISSDGESLFFSTEGNAILERG